MIMDGPWLPISQLIQPLIAKMNPPRMAVDIMCVLARVPGMIAVMQHLLKSGELAYAMPRIPVASKFGMKTEDKDPDVGPEGVVFSDY
jgi:hypothetical protein